MYSEILPMMENLVHEFPVHQDTLWPHCLGHLDSTKIVLEDLKELGYRNANRETGMDYDEASMAIKNLARFHAMSVILIERGMLNTNDFSRFVFGGDFEAINDLIVNSFKSLHHVICTAWSDEWRDIIDRLGKLSEIAVDQLKEIRNCETAFKVLNHGDPWVNNMMFKYSNGSTKPESVKFVDFQLSHYDSFAFDLHYFLSTSVSYEVLFVSDRLILEYTETLGKCLRNMGHLEVPSFNEIMNEMKRTEFFGLFAAITVAPVVCAPSQYAPPKLNTNTEISVEEMDLRKNARYTLPEYTRRLQILLRRAQHGGLLQRICK
ncbi:hypothetical protein O3M35_001101 [Rhynocoris fuscipes]